VGFAHVLGLFGTLFLMLWAFWQMTCQSARNFDPSYCLIDRCYPGGVDRATAD